MEDDWDIIDSTPSLSSSTQKGLLELNFNRFNQQPAYEISSDECPEDYDQQLMDEGVIFSDEEEVSIHEFINDTANQPIDDVPDIHNNELEQQRIDQLKTDYLSRLFPPSSFSSHTSSRMDTPEMTSRESPLDKAAVWKNPQVGSSVPYVSTTIDTPDLASSDQTISSNHEVDDSTEPVVHSFPRPIYGGNLGQFSFNPFPPLRTPDSIAQTTRNFALLQSMSDPVPPPPRRILSPKTNRRTTASPNLSAANLPSFAATPIITSLTIDRPLQDTDIPPQPQSSISQPGDPIPPNASGSLPLSGSGSPPLPAISIDSSDSDSDTHDLPPIHPESEEITSTTTRTSSSDCSVLNRCTLEGVIMDQVSNGQVTIGHVTIRQLTMVQLQPQEGSPLSPPPFIQLAEHELHRNEEAHRQRRQLRLQRQERRIQRDQRRQRAHQRLQERELERERDRLQAQARELEIGKDRLQEEREQARYQEQERQRLFDEEQKNQAQELEQERKRLKEEIEQARYQEQEKQRLFDEEQRHQAQELEQERTRLQKEIEQARYQEQEKQRLFDEEQRHHAQVQAQELEQERTRLQEEIEQARYQEHEKQKLLDEEQRHQAQVQAQELKQERARLQEEIEQARYQEQEKQRLFDEEQRHQARVHAQELEQERTRLQEERDLVQQQELERQRLQDELDRVQRRLQLEQEVQREQDLEQEAQRQRQKDQEQITKQEQQYDRENSADNILQIIKSSFILSLENQQFETICAPIRNKIPNVTQWYTLRRLVVAGQRIQAIHALAGSFPMLEVLDVSNNELKTLTDLPTTICYLYTSHNRLTELDVYHLPQLHLLDCSHNLIHEFKDMSVLKSLRELDASYNHIQDCSMFRSLLGLRKLNLKHNRIETLAGFSGFTRHELDVLNLSYNRIQIVDTIDTLPLLEEVNLNNNSIEAVKFTRAMPYLVSIKLSFNRLTSLDMRMIPAAKLLILDSNPIRSLQGATLNNTHLTSFSLRDQGKEKSAFHLHYLRRTQSLYLSGSPFLKMDQLVDFFALEYLELCSAKLRELPSDFSKRVPNLRCLYLSMNRLENIKPLRKLKYLQRLVLIDNQLFSLNEVIAVVKNMDMLNILDLRKNPISDELYAPIQRTNDDTVSPYISISHNTDWPAQDNTHLEQLSDHWRTRRHVYRAFFIKEVARLTQLDRVAVTAVDRQNADIHIGNYLQENKRVV